MVLLGLVDMLRIVGQLLALIWNIIYFTTKSVAYIPYCVAYNVFRAILPNGYFEDPSPGSVRFYKAIVHHARTKPTFHAFRYNVRMALINLNDPPSWWSQQDGDTMSAEEARNFAGTQGKVMLLTHPPAVGYVQNPISVYYCYNTDDRLEICIAEVTNTPWGERVSSVSYTHLTLPTTPYV